MHILGCPYAILGLIAQVSADHPHDYAMNYEVSSINMGTKMHTENLKDSCSISEKNV